MTPPTDSLVAALRAVPLVMWTGQVKNADGDWIGPVTLERSDYPAVAAAVLEWIRQQMPTPYAYEIRRKHDPHRAWNDALAEMARKLGLT